MEGAALIRNALDRSRRLSPRRVTCIRNKPKVIRTHNSINAESRLLSQFTSHQLIFQTHRHETRRGNINVTSYLSTAIQIFIRSAGIGELCCFLIYCLIPIFLAKFKVQLFIDTLGLCPDLV